MYLYYRGIFSKKTVAFIQPYVVGLRERWQAGSEELPLVSRFRHAALPPRVKWLLFLHEHFSSSHRNKKPYYTVAYTQRIQGGGSLHFSQYYLRGKARRKEDSQKNQVFLWLKLRIWFLRKKIHKRLKNSIQK